MIGTTIIAVVYGDRDDGGVVLAADSQSTTANGCILSEEIVKVLKLTERTYVCMAGNLLCADHVYYSVKDTLRTWCRMYNRTENSFSVRELAGLVSWAIAQDMGTNMSCIVGGWDADGGPQIYFVRGLELTGSYNYKLAGSGSSLLSDKEINDGWNNSNSRSSTKEQVLKLLNMAIKRDDYSGGQVYTIIIDKTAAVKEVLSKSGEVIPNWGWM